MFGFSSLGEYAFADIETNIFISTWNSFYIGGDSNLTNGNLKFSSISENWTTVLAQKSMTNIKKLYWEITFENSINSNGFVGIANQNTNLNSFIGNDSNSFGLEVSFSSFETIGIACNINQSKIWFNNGNWLNGNPNINSGGDFFSISGNIFPAASICNSSTAIANFGTTSFIYAPPIGYAAYGTGFIQNYSNYTQTVIVF